MSPENSQHVNRNENSSSLPYNQHLFNKWLHVMQERLTEIEIKMAHMEQALTELSDVLYLQQGLMEKLEKRYEDLRHRVEANDGAGSGGGPEDEKPPHY